MERRILGKSGIEVSRLCFGGLVIGPLQAGLTVNDGADVIIKALELGVNFIDTAEMYGTYQHIRAALKRFNKKPVIASKAYAYSTEGARESLEKARKEMDIDVVDIFLLHEQETWLTLRGHRDALEYYISAKDKGLIRAVGVSTHNVEVVKVCTEMPEIDIIHPIINKRGIGIGDGTINDMLLAVEGAYKKGKGIYGMKALGGGNLLGSYDESIEFVLNIPYLHSIAVGMQSIEEVVMNVCVFNKSQVPYEVRKALNDRNRHLHVDFWCEGCGRCVDRCNHKALSIAEGKIQINRDKCVLCGYCGSVCPQFAIKIH